MGEGLIIHTALARPKISLATVAKLVLNFLATGLDILATVANRKD
jgi:hypothetical protein